MDVQKAIDNLTKKGFKTRYFAAGAEAAAAVAAELHGVTVGIGGSKTVEALGLYETLSRDNEVFWHWKQPMEEARARPPRPGSISAPPTPLPRPGRS